MAALPDRAGLHRTIWRWHFYAGLFVIPFILLLATTGSFYLFKPQVERWEEREFLNLSNENAVSPEAQASAALAAFPKAQFHGYRLPAQPNDAAMIELAGTPGGQSDGKARQVFVSPQGKVVGDLDPKSRLMEIDKRIHGELLVGKRGSWLVELAASWAIVMILSGLYLWWPHTSGLAGVLWPRLNRGKRVFWRDLHAVTGLWISAFVLVLLTTGLPWAGLWGSAFKNVRAEMGWMATKQKQDWTIGGEPASAEATDMHAAHRHEAGMSMSAPAASLAGLNDIVAKAQAEQLAFPVVVSPPEAPGRFGRPGAPVWTVRSDAQNRSLQKTITYDNATHSVQSREQFSDKHIVDRIVGYGISWHEGQLFGWVNQLIGVLTALGLLTMAVSGFVMWRRRKPEATLGAPAPSTVPARMGGVVAILFVLAVLLPLLAASLIVLWLFDRLVLPRLPRLALWLGVPYEQRSAGTAT